MQHKRVVDGIYKREKQAHGISAMVDETQQIAGKRWINRQSATTNPDVYRAVYPRKQQQMPSTSHCAPQETPAQTEFQVGPFGHFAPRTNFYDAGVIATPVVSVLNIYSIPGILEFPAGISPNYFWI
jgi:hypothetical protein